MSCRSAIVEFNLNYLKASLTLRSLDFYVLPLWKFRLDDLWKFRLDVDMKYDIYEII